MDGDFLPCPFCGKKVKYNGMSIGVLWNGQHMAGCSGACGWQMHDKSYKRMQNKVNRRAALEAVKE